MADFRLHLGEWWRRFICLALGAAEQAFLFTAETQRRGPAWFARRCEASSGDGALAPPHHEGDPGPLRRNKKFPNYFKLICPVQPRAQKQTASRKTQISPRNSAIPARKRGVSRSSRTWGWVAVDAKAPGAQRNRRAGFP